MLRLYTDGSYSEQTAVGSWAWLLIGDGAPRFGSGAVTGRTTPQRMELTAVIEGLGVVPKGASVAVVSDSATLIEPMCRNLPRIWRRNGWRSLSHNRPVTNRDLWLRLLRLTAGRTVDFTWVKAHNGPAGDPGNVMADHMARAARRVREALAA